MLKCVLGLARIIEDTYLVIIYTLKLSYTYIVFSLCIVLVHLRALAVDEGKYTLIKCAIMSLVAVENSERNFRQV